MIELLQFRHSPQPVSGDFRALMDRFVGPPGARWVDTIYARHRVATSDFDGPSAAAQATS